MTKVSSLGIDSRLMVNIGPEVMNRAVVSCIAVLRPIDAPSTVNKYGKVLSHSAILCNTKHEHVLIEYMNLNKVIVSRVGSLKNINETKDKTFKYKGFVFRYISELQKPKCKVTVGQIAHKMLDFMKKRKFDTFTHNCHHARYLTMKFYGMKSEDPYSIQKSVLFQGISDYFKRYQ